MGSGLHTNRVNLHLLDSIHSELRDRNTNQSATTSSTRLALRLPHSNLANSSCQCEPRPLGLAAHYNVTQFLDRSLPLPETQATKRLATD